MNPMLLAIASTLPVAGLMAFRLFRVRDRADAKALRRFLVRASLFCAGCAVLAGTVYAFRGQLPLPMIWVISLEITAAALLISLIRKGD